MLMWSRSRRFTESELGIIDRLLQGGDSRLAKLREQVRQPSAVTRELLSNGERYRAKMDSGFDDLLVDLDVDLWTEQLVATELKSGRRLIFRACLYRGGLFGFLEGETADSSSFPKRFQVRIDASPGPYVVLPPASSDRGARWLCEWLSLPIESCDSVRVSLNAPARREEVLRVEKREAIKLPSDLVELLAVCDGLRVGDFTILGTTDLYTIEDRKTKGKLLVVAVADPEGYVVVPVHSGSSVRLLSMSAPDLDSGLLMGSHFKGFLKRIISADGSVPDSDTLET